MFSLPYKCFLTQILVTAREETALKGAGVRRGWEGLRQGGRGRWKALFTVTLVGRDGNSVESNNRIV